MRFCKDVMEKKPFNRNICIRETSKNMKILNNEIFRRLLLLEREVRHDLNVLNKSDERNKFIRIKKRLLSISMIVDKLDSFPFHFLSRLNNSDIYFSKRISVWDGRYKKFSNKLMRRVNIFKNNGIK